MHPQEFWDSLVSFSKFIYELASSPASWYQNLSTADKTTVKSNITAVITAMLLALVLAVYLNRYIKRRFGYRQSIERPDYSQKVRAAGWVLAAVGRQPWAIQDILPVQAAISSISAESVRLTFFIFLVLFTALFVAEVRIMLRQIKRGPVEEIAAGTTDIDKQEK